MDKKVAILQSNYIPWKGYFDIINSVDEFIFYDEVQYTKNDWRNRNKIKTASGVQWITIPVKQEKLHQRINETRISQPNWAEKHYRMFCTNYARASHFKSYKPLLEETYASIQTDLLCEVNYIFIRLVADILGIRTVISKTTDYKLIEGRTERLLDLVQQAGGNEYVSGPAAKNYLDERLFAEAGIKVSWMDYQNYPEYEQLFPPFEHNVTILDLIFNEGINAKSYMKSFEKIIPG